MVGDGKGDEGRWMEGQRVMWLRGGSAEGRLLIRLIWDDGRVSNRACRRLHGGNSVGELASDEWYGERCCWQQSIISSQ